MEQAKRAAEATVTQRIRDEYGGMTSGQRRLADFVLQNAPEVAMMSSGELASVTGMSESSVVRFAQTLGYQGYPDMRQQLQQEVLKQFRSSDRVAAMVHSRPTQDGPLGTIVAETNRHLQQLLLNVTEDQVAEVVDMILRANRIILFAEGAPASLTVLAEFWLARLGCNVARVNQTGRRLFDQIFQVGAGDLPSSSPSAASPERPWPYWSTCTLRAARRFSSATYPIPGCTLWQHRRCWFAAAPCRLSARWGRRWPLWTP